MKKLFLAGIAVLLLSGCSPTDEQRVRVKQILPENCKIYEVGEYGSIKSLIFVTCDGRNVTTTNGSYQSGKVTRTYTLVSVN